MCESYFPNPCLTCFHAADCSNNCEKRRKWANWWWRRFRGALPKNNETLIQGNGVPFRYENPDIVREYHQHSPCEGCRFENSCDAPCQKYLRWYDCRMDYVRKKEGIKI